MVLYLLVTYGLSSLVVDRKAALFIRPEYTDTEQQVLQVLMTVLVILIIYSVFLPLKLGTLWFYGGLAIYLVGLLFVALATFGLGNISSDAPATQGVFRFSRNPMYFGSFLIFVGTGLASASLVVLVFALIIAALQHYFLIPPEERMCRQRFGESYREYLDKTPKWIGIPE